MNKKNITYLFWLIIIIVQAIWIKNSDGFYFIDDSCHYNFNRHFFETYALSTDAWHRMGRIILFAIPAQFGLTGVQIASSILFLITIYYSKKILDIKNVRYSEWIILIIGFQPVLFNISYTALAELPAAFLIILSYYFYIKNKPSSVMIASSLIFLFRTEYFYVAGIYFLIYAFRKNYKVLPLIITAPVMWYIYTTLATGNPTQFFHEILLHTQLLKIDAGVDWYYYLLHSFKIFGLIQIIFLIYAIIILLKRNQFKEYILILTIAFSGILIHTLLALKGLNLTCSIGQLRYVAVVGPMLGIVSVFGLSSFFEGFKNNSIRNLTAVLLIFILFFWGPFATPFHNKTGIEKTTETISEFVSTQYPDYVVLSQLHQLANAMDEPFTGGKTFKKLNEENLNKYGKSIIVWCNYMEGSPFVDGNVTLKDIEQIPDIKLIKEYKDTVNNLTSVPLYGLRKDDSDNEFSREFIDYITGDQTTWETTHIKVFLKE